MGLMDLTWVYCSSPALGKWHLWKYKAKVFCAALLLRLKMFELALRRDICVFLLPYELKSIRWRYFWGVMKVNGLLDSLMLRAVQEYNLKLLKQNIQYGGKNNTVPCVFRFRYVCGSGHAPQSLSLWEQQ